MDKVANRKAKSQRERKIVVQRNDVKMHEYEGEEKENKIQIFGKQEQLPEGR